MAGSDTQKHLFSLIRDYASEKSQGERRVVGLKKRIEELRSEIEAANTELEDAKRTKEIIEQELKGYEVELALGESSIQTLQSRISQIQDEISAVGSDVDALRNKEGAARDEFISQMLELNAKIRKFQDAIACKMEEECYTGTVAEQNRILVKEEVAEVTITTLQDMLANVVSQMTKEEEEYQSQQNIQKQMQLELIGCERKVSLMEVIAKATEALQDLTRYPYKSYIKRELT
ncbi:uncharacterized protein LOC107415455 isoform X1 [Ziziphus jujuba]|uniref:Uncharacterized protein LOC107415455 isoform X1 n=1 Tax=Ziziphus jujuba TaxID=326968 RepID=A0ABM4A700_ZIZJJ|nr:uncharacterized protein LOC107415455 isoform X1 [Ziziphus jujuba]